MNQASRQCRIFRIKSQKNKICIFWSDYIRKCHSLNWPVKGGFGWFASVGSDIQLTNRILNGIQCLSSSNLNSKLKFSCMDLFFLKISLCISFTWFLKTWTLKSLYFNWPQKGGGGQGPWALTSNLATNWSQPAQLAKLSPQKY